MIFQDRMTLTRDVMIFARAERSLSFWLRYQYFIESHQDRLTLMLTFFQLHPLSLFFVHIVSNVSESCDAILLAEP